MEWWNELALTVVRRARPRRTHDIGLQDSKDSLLGDELRELDAALRIDLILIVLLILILVVRVLLKFGVLDGDNRAGISLDLGTELCRRA